MVLRKNLPRGFFTKEQAAAIMEFMKAMHIPTPMGTVRVIVAEHLGLDLVKYHCRVCNTWRFVAGICECGIPLSEWRVAK